MKLISLLFLGFIIYMFLKTLFGMAGLFQKKKKAEYQLKERKGGEMAEDPVCHTYIPKATALQKKFSGKIIYFCGTECAETYSKRQ